MFKLQNSLQIMGIELRTTNENGRAFAEIPPFWQDFIKGNYAEKLPIKLNNDIYAVYTKFENAGKNNQGMYSLIIGYSVAPSSQTPSGFISVIIPEGNYLQFPVEKNRPEKVGEIWQTIWAIPDNEKRNWLFSCDFERYRTSGEIDIFIGVKN